MRPIDADALLADVGEEPFNWTDTPEEIREVSDYKYYVELIKNAPTIEAESVRTGHWKRRRLRVTASCLYKCSACGQCVNTADIWAYKFCYHCGAKMDEVSE